MFNIMQSPKSLENMFIYPKRVKNQTFKLPFLSQSVDKSRDQRFGVLVGTKDAYHTFWHSALKAHIHDLADEDSLQACWYEPWCLKLDFNCLAPKVNRIFICFVCLSVKMCSTLWLGIDHTHFSSTYNESNGLCLCRCVPFQCDGDKSHRTKLKLRSPVVGELRRLLVTCVYR